MKFWLGTHMTHWLEHAGVPLFVSAVRLRKRRTLPRAPQVWALDSGGFNAIRTDGCYRVSPREYAAEVRRYADEIGNLEWAAIQDWMCEPFMLEKTGCTVGQHQQFTVNSWIALNAIDGSLPWVPVLQGWTVEDYHRCADLYEQFACTRLANLPLVGLGSVCRRQGTQEAAAIVKSLYARGLHNLHGFGFKTNGLVGCSRLANYLRSSDSMAWSSRARNAWEHDRLRLCSRRHQGGCANCKPWALRWRDRLIAGIARVTANGTQLLCF